MTPDAPGTERFDRIASDCIAARVRIINRVVSALYDEALRPHGLRVSQGNILVVIGRVGSAHPADVCRLLRLDKSTLSRDVEIMKAKGWLESDPPTGGRNQILRVTPAGADLLDRARPAWDAAQSKTRLLIGDPGVETIRRIAAQLGPEAAVD